MRVRLRGCSGFGESWVRVDERAVKFKGKGGCGVVGASLSKCVRRLWGNVAVGSPLSALGASDPIIHP